MSDQQSDPRSHTSIEEERHVTSTVQLDTLTRLKLARSILDKTCIETGSGYVLLMFVPGTDTMLRSFRGLDTKEECVAAVGEVAGMLKPHVDQLEAKAPKPLHNDV